MKPIELLLTPVVFAYGILLPGYLAARILQPQRGPVTKLVLALAIGAPLVALACYSAAVILGTMISLPLLLGVGTALNVLLGIVALRQRSTLEKTTHACPPKLRWDRSESGRVAPKLRRSRSEGGTEWLLAFHDDSNANATLVRDGEIVFSVAKERLTRHKYDGGFPYETLHEMFERAGISGRDIAMWICGNETHFLSKILIGRFPDHEHDYLGLLHKTYTSYQHLLYRWPGLRRSLTSLCRWMLRMRLGAHVYQVDHHTCHAYSAYYCSGFPSALAMDVDNFGDGYAAKVFDCREGRCRFLYGSSAMNSPGQFYGELAQLLGINPLIAGKMTGLAAYGDPSPATPLVRTLLGLSENGTDFRLPPLWSKSWRRGIFQELRKFSREEIAAAAQLRFEEVMLEYVRRALERTGQSRLAVAGGCFANVRLNKRILDMPEVEELFVQPGMSDQGISLGAVLYFLAEERTLVPFRLKDVSLGFSYSEEQIEEALEEAALPYARMKEPAREIVDELVQNRTVGYFTGRMEFGPRALGNRSILYHTLDRSVNDWLNKKLHRTETMPFAPVTMMEYADKCYKNVRKARYTAKFMTVAFDCTEWMKKLSPAVVHLDGTARPQLVEEKDHPEYYGILKEYHRRTGIPSLLNTSFNMHEEPIVATARDAARAFLAGGLDRLVLGPFLAKNPVSIHKGTEKARAVFSGTRADEA